MKIRFLQLLCCAIAACVVQIVATAAPIRVLIIDGQNNHDWKTITPYLKKILKETGLFTVDVATSPAKGDMSGFKPNFSAYQVIVSNYNGEPWSRKPRTHLRSLCAGRRLCVRARGEQLVS